MYLIIAWKKNVVLTFITQLLHKQLIENEFTYFLFYSAFRKNSSLNNLLSNLNKQAIKFKP